MATVEAVRDTPQMTYLGKNILAQSGEWRPYTPNLNDSSMEQVEGENEWFDWVMSGGRGCLTKCGDDDTMNPQAYQETPTTSLGPLILSVAQSWIAPRLHVQAH